MNNRRRVLIVLGATALAPRDGTKRLAYLLSP